MNSFPRGFMKTALWLICAGVLVFNYSRGAAQQREEEMQTLQMFYRQKDLVVSPTRHPKPISQVAENIAVVTAEEIEAMNAHTVAEVITRVAGVFVNYNRDFGASSLISIQASAARQVLVLVDGVRWNFLAEGSAETNSIPVGIIDRIEIIRGPASSAWGSALGGVVNIITKPVGDTLRPAGLLRASYGKDNTQDYRAELAGQAGALGYYLFGGYQETDGLRNSREYDNPSFYSKLNLPVFNKANLGFSFGYGKPDNDFGKFRSQDIELKADNRNIFSTASLDAALADGISVDAAVYYLDQEVDQQSNALGEGINGSAGELFLKNSADEQKFGANGKLIWQTGRHTAVLGGEYGYGDLDQTQRAGSVLQLFGVPARSNTNSNIHRWAAFANDTMVFDRLAVTPGIRYDYNDITGSFVSPSLGVTYTIGENSILRAAVARGFTIPPLSFTSGGGLFLSPNSDLDPEKVWSYQAGAETAAIPYLWLKATVFYHDLDDRLTRELFEAGPPTFNDIFVNSGSIERRGVELELQTAAVYHFSFLGNFAYTDLSPASEAGSDKIWAYNLGLQYDDQKSFKAQLFGHFIKWDFDPSINAEDDDIIWDFNLSKRFNLNEKTAAVLFGTVHNILNGDQFTQGEDENPRRWAEAGIRFTF